MIRWLILLTVAVLIEGQDDMGRTLLCQKCKCLNETVNNPDVDCSEQSIQTEFLDPKYYGNNGTLFRINSLTIQNHNIPEISKIFPNSTLKKLDLSHNGIKKIVDLAFSNLTELVELDLSYNNLNALTPAVFKGATHIDGFDYPLLKLRILRLDGNQIHSLDNDVFQHIEKQIEVISLSHNPFKTIDAHTNIAISGLPNLREMDLSYTQISDLPMGFLHTPKNLKTLNLSGNNFVKIPQELGNVHNLEHLLLSNNLFETLDENNTFPNISTLKILHLCNNPKLEHIGAHALSRLGNLVELYIMGNALTKLDKSALTRKDFENEMWPPLQKLSLYNNKLGYLDLHFYAHWDNLKYLDLRQNPWTCDCENQWLLEELMPIYVKLNQTEAAEVKCGAPIEMEGKTLFNLTQKHSEMRCLDMYGNRPEKDGSVLIGLLVGLLIAIPLMLFLMYAYQRHWFGLFDKSPAAYSRQFYRTTPTDDGF